MSNATWSVEQIRQAKRLRARVAVDIELVARFPKAKSEAAAKMAKRLIDMGHPLGIEINEGDFQVEWLEDDDRPWQVTGEMRWRPSTREVEFLGGQNDGMRLEVQRVGDPIEVARPLRPVEFFESAANEPVSIDRDTYELVGWREAERVWVYATR